MVFRAEEIRTRILGPCSTAKGRTRDPPRAGVGSGGVRSSRSSRSERDVVPVMHGRHVFRLRHPMPERREAARPHGVCLDELDLLVMHQANLRINEAAQKRSGSPTRSHHKLRVRQHHLGDPAPLFHEARAAGKPRALRRLTASRRPHGERADAGQGRARPGSRARTRGTSLRVTRRSRRCRARPAPSVALTASVTPPAIIASLAKEAAVRRIRPPRSDRQNRSEGGSIALLGVRTRRALALLPRPRRASLADFSGRFRPALLRSRSDGSELEEALAAPRPPTPGTPLPARSTRSSRTDPRRRRRWAAKESASCAADIAEIGRWADRDTRGVGAIRKGMRKVGGRPPRAPRAPAAGRVPRAHSLPSAPASTEWRCGWGSRVPLAPECSLRRQAAGRRWP